VFVATDNCNVSHTDDIVELLDRPLYIREVDPTNRLYVYKSRATEQS